MKKLKFIIACSLFVLLYSAAHAQYPGFQFLPENDNRNISFAEPGPGPDNNALSGPLDDEGRLRAQKTDNWEAGAWVGTDSIIYSYDVNGLFVESIILRFTSGSWGNSVRNAREYDANDNAVLYLTQIWGGNTWVNDRRSIREYDVNNNQTLSRDQDWDGTNWIDTYQVIFEYDENNNNTLILHQDWLEGWGWINLFRTTSEYDENNNLILASSQSWDDFFEEWANSSRFIYEYNADNSTANYIRQGWGGSDWVNQARRLYEYDGDGNRTLTLNQAWDGMDWTNNNRLIYDYYPENSQVISQIQNWDGSSWVNRYKTIEDYDERDNRIFSFSQVWNETEWENLGRTFYYYEALTNIDAPDRLSVDFHAFPNPSSGHVTVALGENGLQNGMLHVYNSAGKLVHTQAVPPGESRQALSLGSLPEGAYFLQLRDGARQAVRQALIVR